MSILIHFGKGEAGAKCFENREQSGVEIQDERAQALPDKIA